MNRFCLLLVILFSAVVKSKAGYLNDSSQNKLIDRLVSGIAAKCKLSDSTKKELSNYFYDYYIKLQKLRNSENEKLKFHDKLLTIKAAFLKNLKLNFGNEVYQSYKESTRCYILPTRKKLKRITER